MKIKFQYPFLAGLIGCMLIVASCKRNSENPFWNVDLLTPLVQSSLTISNIVKDTGFVQKNPDNSVTIVNRQKLAEITLDSLVTLNTTPFAKTVTLDSLVLETRSDTTRITIGSIADSLIASGVTDNVNLGNAIKLAALFGFPADLSNLPVLGFGSINIDANSFFREADIAAGTLSIKIVNKLPGDIQNLSFDLHNRDNGNLVFSHSFTNIPALGGEQSTSEDLTGKVVEGFMKGNISTLKVVGPTNAIINLNQAIEVIMTISGVRVNSATAVFPTQDIVQNEDESPLTGLGDVELTYAEIDSGAIKVDVSSTAQDNVYFTYEIPEAIDKNGNPFKVVSTVPAATAGNPVNKTFTYNLAGYKMDLRGKNHNTVNTIYSKLTGSIKYSGKLVYFSLADYMTVNVSAVDLKPAYVKGYLGQNTVAIGPGATTLDIFKGIESGTLNFENINMKVVVENGFGLDGSVKINNISSENSKTGASRMLSGPNIGNLITINKATDNPYASASNTIDMSTGANATDLINILPDKVTYFAQVQTNPGGNTHTYTDFAYKTGKLGAYLDIEMPLSIMASQLVLGDTAVFNTMALQKRNVKSGTFKVFVNNGFPLNAALKMYFLNPAGVAIDSVQSLPGAIQAAPVNGVNRVVEKKASQVAFEVNEERMNNLYNSVAVIFKLQFTTEPAAAFVKIYSDYSIDFKMVGDMNYSIHKK